MMQTSVGFTPEQVVLQALLKCERIDVVLVDVLLDRSLLFQHRLRHKSRRKRHVVGHFFNDAMRLTPVEIAAHLENDSIPLDRRHVVIGCLFAAAERLTGLALRHPFPRRIDTPEREHSAIVHRLVNLRAHEKSLANICVQHSVMKKKITVL